jgi:hypothetical protein
MKIRTENKVETSQNRRKIMSGKPQGAKLLATIQKARQRREKKKNMTSSIPHGSHNNKTKTKKKLKKVKQDH